MTKFIIEVNDDNLFNEGWLAYLLGEPKPAYIVGPDEEATPPSPAADGWNMGAETPGVRAIRAVFAQDMYSVSRAVDPKRKAEPVPSE
jgi:hypothetical protein